MKPRTPPPEPRRRCNLPNRRAPHQRGAAYVEAILVVMFMIIIFVGVIYLGNYFDAKMRALNIARQCAWGFSKNACVEGNLPAICDAALAGGVEEEKNEALAKSIQGAQNESQGLPENREPGSGKKEQQQEDLRVGVEAEMNPMMELLVGQSLTAEGSGAIVVPRMIPNAQSKIAVTYWLPCNLAHKDPFDVAMNLFGSLFGKKKL